MNIFIANSPIYIKGPSCLLPGKKISNQELIDTLLMDKNPAVVSFTTGIKSRHWVDNQSCSDLAVEVAQHLFAYKPGEREKIKQLILA